MIWRPERAKALVSWLTTITTTLSVPFRQWMVTNSKRMATNHSKFLSKRPSGNDKIHLHLSSYFSFTGLVSFFPPLHTFVIHTSVKNKQKVFRSFPSSFLHTQACARSRFTSSQNRREAQMNWIIATTPIHSLLCMYFILVCFPPALLLVVCHLSKTRFPHFEY